MRFAYNPFIRRITERVSPGRICWVARLFRQRIHEYKLIIYFVASFIEAAATFLLFRN